MRKAPLSDDPKYLLGAAHDDQLALCATLESIADSLPDKVDRPGCMKAARAVGPLFARVHALEEDIVFPAVTARWQNFADIAATVDRLKHEHLEDSCFAEELHDALMAYGRGENSPNPEALGYMLRGFFESLRRHIAFEREVIVPLFAMAEAAASPSAPRAAPDRE
ncbi:hemerythrin domain-containing protein [Pelagibacterium sp.]|uniref:hemerythrin domain-containing protein n=1 Tax=Pelagibacterium sp. TaxID=1967288 RepID=UPI003A9006F7